MKIAGAPISWGVCELPGGGYQLEPDRVLVWDSVSGESTDIAAKRVVIASRMESSRSLADALRGRTAARVHVIGDAVAPRKLADALLEGARVGHWL